MRCRCKKNAFKPVVFLLITLFVINVIMPPVGYAQAVTTVLDLPIPGQMVPLSKGYNPTIIRGLTIHPKDPLAFDFIVDKGDAGLQGDNFKAEANKLVKYFLTSLTVPENELWVNLSPYEKDRIISESFGITKMGRDLLAQDYILKQLSSSLIYPEKKLGQKFWDRVYSKAEKLYGTTDIPMNTFNKIWIVPEKAIIYEHGNSAYVLYNKLKVMLEEDYVALQKNMGSEKNGMQDLLNKDVKVVSGVTSDVVREVLIPEIEKEVNEGKTFANLRQIANSMVLATWYKQNLKESLLGKVYVDKKKIAGVDVEDKEIKEKIYKQYTESFKKGVFNYIKEDFDPVTQQIIPRKYFSGGMQFNYNPKNVTSINSLDSLDNLLSRDPSLKEQIRTIVNRIDSRGQSDEEKTVLLSAELFELTGSPTSLDINDFRNKFFNKKTDSAMSSVLTGTEKVGLMDEDIPVFREIKNFSQEVAPMELNVIFDLIENDPSLRDNLEKIYPLLKKNHPSLLYHDLKHSIETALLDYLYAKQDASLHGKTKVAQGAREIFKFSQDQLDMILYTALLHDFDPYREANSPARVPESIKLLENDFNRRTSLEGVAGESFLRDRLGFDERKFLMMKAIIQRTEFPFNGQSEVEAAKEDKNILVNNADFYTENNTTPRQEYEKTISRIAEKYEEDLPFVLEQGIILSEFADKPGGYLLGDLSRVLNIVSNLYKEFKNVGALPNFVTLKAFLGSSYNFFQTLFGDINQTLAYDMRLANKYGIVLNKENLRAEKIVPAVLLNNFKAIKSSFGVLQGVLQKQDVVFNDALNQAQKEYLSQTLWDHLSGTIYLTQIPGIIKKLNSKAFIYHNLKALDENAEKMIRATQDDGLFWISWETDGVYRVVSFKNQNSFNDLISQLTPEELNAFLKETGIRNAFRIENVETEIEGAETTARDENNFLQGQENAREGIMLEGLSDSAMAAGLQQEDINNINKFLSWAEKASRSSEKNETAIRNTLQAVLTGKTNNRAAVQKNIKTFEKFGVDIVVLALAYYLKNSGEDMKELNRYVTINNAVKRMTASKNISKYISPYGAVDFNVLKLALEIQAEVKSVDRLKEELDDYLPVYEYVNRVLASGVYEGNNLEFNYKNGIAINNVNGLYLLQVQKVMGDSIRLRVIKSPRKAGALMKEVTIAIGMVSKKEFEAFMKNIFDFTARSHTDINYLGSFDRFVKRHLIYLEEDSSPSEDIQNFNRDLADKVLNSIGFDEYRRGQAWRKLRRNGGALTSVDLTKYIEDQNRRIGEFNRIEGSGVFGILKNAEGPYQTINFQAFQTKEEFTKFFLGVFIKNENDAMQLLEDLAPGQDAAMSAKIDSEQPVGGIDLDPAMLDLQIRRDDKGVPLPIWDQPLKDMNIQGFLPVIINVTPVNLKLPILSEFQGDKQAPKLASSV